jgi:16S rRNA (uracil1498-N3)-methyltransferase
MADRYFVEQPIGDQPQAELRDSEAQHLGKVMRAQVGDVVLLFDGTGMEYTASIAALAKNRILLDIRTREVIDRELPREITLAVALPKGERQRFLVEKCVELGVQRLIPLKTKRGVAEADAHVVERLARQVIEASKQCGRNRLMQVTPAMELTELVAFGTAIPERCLAHPSGTAASSWPSDVPVLVAIGPEGGFTESELAHAQAAQWNIISLGKRILRVETAALAVAARLGS